MYNNKYPFIFIHGMMGWGEEEKMYDAIPYWGMVCGNLVKQLRAEGLEAYAPQVSPIGSAWARACELYASLTGTRVDYGAAHAAKYHHERFGRTYDTPLVEGWGQPMADGGIKKIHLLGHSFGGATMRMLVTLLEDGAEEERAATPAEELSPLFAGGHGAWVQTLTAISAPHDGTTFVHAFPTLMKVLKPTVTVLLTLLANLGGGKVYDIHMEQYGMNEDPFHASGKKHLFLSKKQLQGLHNICKYKDNVFDDLRIDQAAEMGKRLHPCKDTYYFSIAGKGTNADARNPEFQVRAPIMTPAFIPFAKKMGKFPIGTIGGIKIDKTWRANDGLVPLSSARHPQKEPFIHFEDDPDLQKGIWHVMPDYEADHGTVIGGSTSYIGKGKSRPYDTYWREHLHMLMSLED